MTRLSACYFCGTALDDTLDDYPVVPETLRGDDADPTTVTLCPSCHEKLDAIVAKLTDSIDASAADVTSLDSAADTSADDADGLVDPVPDEPASDGPASDGPVSDGPVSDGPASDGPASDGPASDEPTEAEGADAEDGDSAGDDSGERTVVEGKHDVSALEYNKVMRLLQNREFPVDREEIEIVAANAYQVARSDCAQVIDVAVDRGLIEEADGQLRKPDSA